MNRSLSIHRSSCCVLMLLLLTILVGCQPDQSVPIATITSTSFCTPTAEPGQIFFIRGESVQDGYEDHCDNLWVMYPDGSQLHQLTNDKPPGIGYHIPDDKLTALVFASATQVVLNTDLIQQISISEECQTPLFPEHGNNRVFDFRFSPSGRYVSFIVGNYECGESVLRTLDRETGTCLEVEGNDRLVRWLSDDRALVAMARCEYGALSLYDSSTTQMKFLGYGSIRGWNQDRTAFFAFVPDHIGWENVLWAYNLRADTFIHRSPRHFDTDQPDSGQSETALGWTSDGIYMLYASRRLSYTYDLTHPLPATTTFGPQQLYIVDNLGQHDHPLIDDPTHNYFLRGQDVGRLIIQSTPYQLLSVPDGPVDWNALECPLHGRECSSSEYFLLDWHTGKLTPLGVPPTPTVTPAVGVTAPNLNSKPIYSASDGSFALYSGKDGTGLWQVSVSGESVLLIADGHHFVYVEKQ